jgi:glutathione S-transferase
MSFLEEKGIEYNKVDIAEKSNEEALIKMGGKRQVPFLVDKDRNIQMYESMDIIEYIKTII